MNKYIEDLGIKFEDTPWGWDNNGERQVKWQEQRDTYGFDERETWGLDFTFGIWLYTRVKMFKEVSSKIIKLDFNKFIIDDKEYTQLEIIDQILENTKIYLTSSDDNIDKLIKSAELFAKVLPAMWW